MRPFPAKNKRGLGTYDKGGLIHYSRSHETLSRHGCVRAVFGPIAGLWAELAVRTEAVCHVRCSFNETLQLLPLKVYWYIRCVTLWQSHHGPLEAVQLHVQIFISQVILAKCDEI